MSGKVHKVRTPLFPTYMEVQQVIPILEGASKNSVKQMINAIWEQTGTPQKPVDWSEPDIWIEERLSGEERSLAKRIWEESCHAVNPRHIYGSYLFINSYQLLELDSSGIYRVTKQGQKFLENDPTTVREIDDLEGLLRLLEILEIKTKAKRGDILPEWSTFLREYSKYGTESTIKETLRKRLLNLAERGLIDRDGTYYSINQQGIGYLEGFKGVDPLREITRSIIAYNESQREALHGVLKKMDPFLFEELISDLLDAMGYEDVVVTKRSGDKGIDVLATAQFGMTRVKEVVQVKRRKGRIQRSEMDKLRGSLPYYDAIRGTFITLGKFARGCIDYALLERAAPITLIDGTTLIDLLVEHEIGIKKKRTDILEIEEDVFSRGGLPEELEETIG